MKLAIFMLGFILLVGGCSDRIVYVPHGQAVRLRQTIKNVKVWAKAADGEIIAGKMDLPEGWYCLPKEVKSDGE